MSVFSQQYAQTILANILAKYNGANDQYGDRDDNFAKICVQVLAEVRLNKLSLSFVRNVTLQRK